MPKSQEFDNKQIDSRQRKLEDLKMFFHKSNGLAAAQELKNVEAKQRTKDHVIVYVSYA